MPSIASAYRGPLVIIGLGSGFSVVGAVPVAITFSIGSKTSATIIGMGFVGFGFLLILPGLFWCIMVRTHSFKFWRRRRKRTASEEEEITPTLNCSISSRSDVRERHWPPSDYNSAPPLLIASSSLLSSSPTSTQTKTTNCPGGDVFLVNADVDTPRSALVDFGDPPDTDQGIRRGPPEGSSVNSNVSLVTVTTDESKLDADEGDQVTGSTVSVGPMTRTISGPVELSDDDAEDHKSSLN